MTEAILAEAGPVVRDAHVHAWAARLRLSPAAVLAFAAARSQLVVVTQRCLFDVRAVVRTRTPVLRNALLAFDNAHSLLELGKRVCVRVPCVRVPCVRACVRACVRGGLCTSWTLSHANVHSILFAV